MTALERRLMQEAADRFLASSPLLPGATVRLGIEGRHNLRFHDEQRVGTVTGCDGASVYVLWQDRDRPSLMRRDYLEPVK